MEFSSVCYHYLARDDEFKRIWGHSLGLFKEHVNYYRDNYQIISFDDIRNNDFSSQKNLLLTFDDGLKEQSSIIAKYLDKFNIKALFNIPSCILKNEPANPQIVHFSAAHYGIRKLYKFIEKEIKSNYLDRLGILPANSGSIETIELLKIIKNIIKRELNYLESRQILLSIYNNHLAKDFPDFVQRIYLSKDDIIQLFKNGHAIGVHTDTHCVVKDIINDSEIVKKELKESKAIFSELLGKDADIFAYPFGAKDDVLDEPKPLLDLGYNYILTTFSHDQDFNKLNIGRYCSQSQDRIDALKNNIWDYKI